MEIWKTFNLEVDTLVRVQNRFSTAAEEISSDNDIDHEPHSYYKPHPVSRIVKPDGQPNTF